MYRTLEGNEDMNKKIYKVLIIFCMLPMLFVQACNSTKSDIPETDSSYNNESINKEEKVTYMEYDKDSISVKKEPVSYEKTDEINSENLYKLYASDDDKLSLYCYKNDGTDEDAGKLAIYDSKEYYIFDVNIYTYMYDENSVYFTCFDYDNDGYPELGAALVFEDGTMQKHQKLFIIDYNMTTDGYELYFLGTEDFSEDIDDSIKLFYSNIYGIEYELKDDNTYPVNIENVYCNELESEGENPVVYGEYTSVNYPDSDSIEYIIGIDEALPKRQIEGPDYIDIGSLFYNINYSGDGLFIINARQYIEQTYLRG